jgi:Uma2 family endonuclease
MVAQPKQITMPVEEFDRYEQLPENSDRLLEYIGGEIVDAPSNPFASSVSSLINRKVGYFVDEHKLGHVTGEAGGYRVSGERYAPDVAFISYVRQPELARQGYNPNPPELAVEVDYPSTYQSQEQLRIKIANYIAAGTVVWLVRPETRMVEVYVPGKAVQKLGLDGVLDGGDVLPGFRLPVKDIFPA